MEYKALKSRKYKSIETETVEKLTYFAWNWGCICTVGFIYWFLK
jgi:hypothetical protein